MKEGTVLFKEVQKLRAWWLVLLILIPAGLVWWGAVQQLVLGEVWGNNPASDEMLLIFLLIFGIAMPLVLLNIRLVVSVGDVVSIRFWPFNFKRWEISPREITHHQAVTYRPISEYGGWGIKGTRQDRAYNISGDKGVKLYMSDGRTVMIGSQRSEELSMAIGAMRGRSRDH